MKLSVLVCGVAISAIPLMSRPSGAQGGFLGPSGSGYQGAMGYQYNTMQGATMSVMLQGMQQQAMSRSLLMSSMYGYGAYGGRSRPTAAQLQAQRGQRLIKRGRATTKFPMRSWPSSYWMANTVVNKSISAEEDRRIRYNGMRVQRAEFARQVRARGARWGDMADMMAIATVIVVETYTGRRVNNQGFRTQAALWRKAWLKDASFQGRTVASKQLFYEGQILLGSTYPWWLRHVKGDVAEAKRRSAMFLDEWYVGKTAGVIRDYAPYFEGATSTRLANASRKSAVRTSTVVAAPAQSTNLRVPSLAQATQVVRFQRASQLLLPTMIAQQQPGEKREETRQMANQLLQLGRAQMRQSLMLPTNTPDDVAQAMTWMVGTLYLIARTPLDKPGTVGIEDAHIAALRRQFTLLLATDPKFKTQSARQKQMMYEGALLMPTLLIVLQEATKREGDREAQEQVRTMAAQSLQQFIGVSPDKMRFSDGGLSF